MNRRPRHRTRAIKKWWQEHRPRSAIGRIALVAVPLAVVLGIVATIAVLLPNDDKPAASPALASEPAATPSGCEGGEEPWQWKEWANNDSATGQCIGFVTGSSSLATKVPEAKEVLDQIDALNNRVVSRENVGATAPSTRSYVTVVAMLALSGETENRPVDALSGIHQLRGIYAALKEHNGEEGNASKGGKTPRIQLVVADVGSAFAFVDKVADKVVDNGKKDATFAGVIGLNQGRGETSSAVAKLDKEGIPMVATTATSDDLTEPLNDARRFKSYWRIAAKNKSEAYLIKKFLSSLEENGKPPPSNPLIVYRTDNDGYSNNLADDVQKEYAPDPSRFKGFDGQTRDQVTQNITKALERCGNYDAIVFTGRADDVRALSKAMNEAACGNIPVVAGDDVAVLDSAKDVAKLKDHVEGWENRKLYFVDYAVNSKDERPSSALPGTVHPFFAEYEKAFQEKQPASSGMIAYDAFVVIAKAAEKTEDPANKGRDVRTVVNSGLSAICDPHPVQGATGVISFNYYGDPQYKDLVIREFSAENFSKRKYRYDVSTEKTQRPCPSPNSSPPTTP